MKLVRFSLGKEEFEGRLEAEKVVYSDAYGELHKVELDSVRLLAPVAPTKIVCVGLNYAGHAAEMGLKPPRDPVIFIKPSSAVLGPDSPIHIPRDVGQVDYEAELAFVVGRTSYKVRAEESKECILGYTCLNDITARDLQRIDGQWTRAKSFDSFAPIGPCVDTEFRPSNKMVRCYLNGEKKQEASTNEFIFKIPEIFEFVSSCMTLYPGDVISTGTPAGIGPISRGDVIEVEIEGIGRLTNTVE